MREGYYVRRGAKRLKEIMGMKGITETVCVGGLTDKRQ